MAQMSEDVEVGRSINAMTVVLENGVLSLEGSSTKKTGRGGGGGGISKALLDGPWKQFAVDVHRMGILYGTVPYKVVAYGEGPKTELIPMVLSLEDAVVSRVDLETGQEALVVKNPYRGLPDSHIAVSAWGNFGLKADGRFVSITSPLIPEFRRFQKLRQVAQRRAAFERDATLVLEGDTRLVTGVTPRAASVRTRAEARIAQAEKRRQDAAAGMVAMHAASAGFAERALADAQAEAERAGKAFVLGTVLTLPPGLTAGPLLPAEVVNYAEESAAWRTAVSTTFARTISHESRETAGSSAKRRKVAVTQLDELVHWVGIRGTVSATLGVLNEAWQMITRLESSSEEGGGEDETDLSDKNMYGNHLEDLREQAVSAVEELAGSYAASAKAARRFIFTLSESAGGEDVRIDVKLPYEEDNEAPSTSPTKA